MEERVAVGLDNHEDEKILWRQKREYLYTQYNGLRVAYQSEVVTVEKSLNWSQQCLLCCVPCLPGIGMQN